MIIVRRKRPLMVIPSSIGKGWIGGAGYPPNPHETAMHVLEDSEGRRMVFEWRPEKGMWQGGTNFSSPVVVQKFNYLGPCTIVYRAWIPAEASIPRRRK